MNTSTIHSNRVSKVDDSKFLRAERRPGPRTSDLGTFAFLAGILLALLFTVPAEAQPAPVTVRVEPVRSQEMQERHRVTGTLRAAARASVAARESAAVLGLDVREGDRVKAGQQLLRFDTARLEAELREAEAQLEAAKSAQAQREAEARRALADFSMQESLHRSGATAKNEYLDAVRNLEVAQAQQKSAGNGVSEARGRVDRIRIRLADLKIVAPFDGRVVARHVEAGEWMNPGQPIVTVISDRMEAWLTVPERYAGPVRRFSKEIAVEAAAAGFRGSSDRVRIVQDIDPRARTFPVIVEFDNQDGVLAAGMSVVAWVPGAERREELVVNRDAVIRRGENTHVMRIVRENAAARAVSEPVHVLFQDSDHVAIASSTIRVGDEVVIEGNERLAPNTPVSPVSDSGIALSR